MDSNQQYLKARDILALTEDDLWAWEKSHDPTVPVKIEFDAVDVGGVLYDGLVGTYSIQSTVLSWYIWKIHRLYPETPLLDNHHIGGYNFTSKSIPDIMTRIVNTLIPTYWGRISFEELGKDVLVVENDIYNMVINHLGEYVGTMDATDFIELFYNEDIKTARENCISDGSARAIRELYEAIPRIVDHKDFLPNNAIADNIRLRSTPMGQIIQSIGIRGKVTDIDSSVFPNTIFGSFGSGINDIADFIVESRSASKALIFQKDPIRDTEYFNRRLQILNQTVRWVVPGDCGSTKYLSWHVQPGDLKSLAGRYYRDDDGKLKVIDITKSSTNRLVGKTILLRSPTTCNHGSRYGVCHTCLGNIALTIPLGANVGHLAAYIIGEKTTQPVLSVKHLDDSAEIKEIALDLNDLKYVRLSSKRNELIMFNSNLAKKRNLTILLPVENVGNLTQAMATDKLSELSIYKISKLEKIGVKYEVEKEGMTIVDWVMVSGPSRLSSLSIPFLEHIKKVKYFQEDSKYIEVRLDGWDYNQPAFQLPLKQINMLDFMAHFSDMIECGPKDKAKRGLDPSNPADLVSYVRSLYEYSSQYIDVPLVYLEVTTLGLMIRSGSEHDYRIPEVDEPAEFASADNIMLSRSVGSALAYMEQANTIYNPNSYKQEHRVPHPMDVLFCPDPDADIYKKFVYTGE